MPLARHEVKLNSGWIWPTWMTNTVKQHWEMWRKNAHYYPSRVMWWCRLMKQRIRLLFSLPAWNAAENMRLFNTSTAVRCMLSCRMSQSWQSTCIKELKGIDHRVNNTYYRSMWVDNGVQDRFGEDPSLHHLMKERKRQVQRTVHMIHDKNGSAQTSSIDILRVFAEHFKRKYDTIPVSGECIKRLVDCNL